MSRIVKICQKHYPDEKIHACHEVKTELGLSNLREAKEVVDLIFLQIAEGTTALSQLQAWKDGELALSLPQVIALINKARLAGNPQK